MLQNFFKYINDQGEVQDDRTFSSFSALVSWRLDGHFAFKYYPVISALAGGYVAFLLLTFCVDIALRIIKLIFLQMLAPISIISYIDPKEKSSDSKLGRWAKECATTYLSLFLRLATIFLAMLLVQMIADTVISDGGVTGDKVWADDSIGTPNAIQTMFIYVFCGNDSSGWWCFGWCHRKYCC